MRYKSRMEKTIEEFHEDLLTKMFKEYGDPQIDKQIAIEIQVPVFTGERLKALKRKVNALMERQLELPLDNIWRVELRDNDRVKLTDFTMPSSSSILNKTIPISEAPKFIQNGLAVLQISQDGALVDGIGKRISDTVYYIVERNDGSNTREEGEGCS